MGVDYIKAFKVGSLLLVIVKVAQPGLQAMCLYTPSQANRGLLLRNQLLFAIFSDPAKSFTSILSVFLQGRLLYTVL